MRGGQNNRRGSALLIVLGMLAFMVISAVAFSAYMRSSRLPSSFLRRTVSSRLLVKAALAEAIEEIDVAISDNPHPGVTVSTNTAVSGYKYYFPRNATGSIAQNRNWWKGRVYIGTNLTDGIGVPLKITVPQRETVPTLTLEGLAYIPPPLINEARYYSRHSSAGKWHSLPYDAGRYAFTAIDVSDYFDVNAVPSDGRRTSAPEDRITLSYLFPDKASGMGSFMKQLCDNKLPLVSLADWNLAINYDSSYGLNSPFCQYLRNPNVDFYSSYGNQEEIRKMTFVTDSWLPAESSTASGNQALIDLSNDNTQPFQQYLDTSSYDVSYEDVVGRSQNDTIDRLREFLPQGSIAALYDYLDADSVPLSLALPTTEKTPMICGVKPTLSGTAIEVASEDRTEYGQEQLTDTRKTRRAKRTLVYRLKDGCLGAMNVDPMVVFPFRNQESDTFAIDGRLALFFTTAPMGLRPANCVDALQVVNDKNRFPQLAGSSSVVKDGVWTFPLASQPVKFNASEDMSSAVKDAGLTLELDGDALSAVDEALVEQGKFLEATFEWTQESTKDPDTGTWSPFAPEFEAAMQDQGSCNMDIQASSTFRALNADGSLNGDFKATGQDLLTKLQSGISLQLNLAVWLRLKGTSCKDGRNDNKTVDLVPASVADDDFNDSPNINGPEGQGIADGFGNTTPLLRFDTGVSFTFKITDALALDPGAAGAKGVTLAPEAAMIGDPRFNYAPENWYQAAVGDFNGGTWLNKCHIEDGDGDIFLQVSDQRYLQSVYELANLPRLGKDGFGTSGNGSGTDEGTMVNPSSYSATTLPTYGNELNREYMWKSYDPFGRYNRSGSLNKGSQATRTAKTYPAVGGSASSQTYVGDGFEALGIVNRGIGFRINPYSDSTNVMMAAFANTPHDWRSASPDNDELPTTASAFNSQHSWDEDSTEPTLKDDTLEDLIGALMSDIRDTSVRPQGCESKWEAAFQQLGWWGDADMEGDSAQNNLIAGVPTGGDKIYNNERKFLYGFWRECFAVKQQLFLIFVRAEPSMMGSGASGKAPPNLGGRAVALVWRDPNPAVDASEFSSAGEGVSVPHKTRILFYHTLE